MIDCSDKSYVSFIDDCNPVTNVCIIFPKDLEIKQDKTNQITFYVDYSRVNLVWMVLNTITQKVSAESEEISMDLTQGLLEKLSETATTMDDDKIVVDGLVDGNQELTDKMNVLYSNLRDIELDIDEDDFKIVSVKAKTADLYNISSEAISEAQNLIVAVRDKMSDANCSDGDVVHDLIDDAELVFIDLSDNLTETYNGSGALKHSLSDLENAVDDVIYQFERTEETKDKILTDPTLNSQLKKTKDTLVELKTSMVDLEESIASLEITNASRIVNPITTKIQPVTVEQSHFNYAFPTLLVLVIMITAVLLSSTMVMREKKATAFFRNAISPVRDIIFNLGAYATGLIVLFFQIALFLIIAGLFFSVDIWAAFLVTLVVLLLLASVFIVIGMIVGTMFKSEETATLASITMSCVMLFFSSTVLPIESMSESVRTLAMLNPFVVGEFALKESIVFAYGFPIVGKYIILLAGYLVVLFLLLLLLQFFMKKKFMFRKKKHRVK